MFPEYRCWMGPCFGSNENWTAFNWDGRADFFWNRGKQCKVTIYQHERFKGAGMVL